MNDKTRYYFRTVLNNSLNLRQSGNFAEAWKLLEEGHIVSQPFARMHTIIHWHMFRLAWEERSFHEIVGQSARLILAAPGSLLGKYPLGNTGRSTISMFMPMAITEEIARKIQDLSK